MKLYKICNECDVCWLEVAETAKQAHEKWQTVNNPYDLESPQYDISVQEIFTVRGADSAIEFEAFVSDEATAMIDSWRREWLEETNKATKMEASDDLIPF